MIDRALTQRAERLVVADGGLLTGVRSSRSVWGAEVLSEWHHNKPRSKQRLTNLYFGAEKVNPRNTRIKLETYLCVGL